MSLTIDGRDLSAHPLAFAKPTEWAKTATVLAVESPDFGEVATPEGRMTFHIGDFIVTDNPPTHAWPVQRDVFLRTYVRVTPLDRADWCGHAIDPVEGVCLVCGET